VTAEITGGSLGGMLTDNNTTLPGYTAQLNTLAQTFADQVNGQLAQGLDQSGASPTTNLFSYDQSSYSQSGDAASTLAVSSITPDQIASASAGAPGGNGNAIAVAALATTPAVNGLTFTQAFANLTAQVGSDVAGAQQNQTEGQDLLTQAQQQRQQVSGVDLNAEAAKLLQVQQSYQAVGQLVSVLNSLTQTLMNILPPGTAS
jgi:flagellar hook-associated protein 1 FlgK